MVIWGLLNFPLCYEKGEGCKCFILVILKLRQFLGQYSPCS